MNADLVEAIAGLRDCDETPIGVLRAIRLLADEVQRLDALLTPVPHGTAGGFGTGYSHQCQVCLVWVIAGQIHTCAGRPPNYAY